ncbi:hypothetical protein [Nocardia thailandica]|uniref:hypothetical protein n=1 Tax=Nocardia thailandica TaxID=257275 RepID=UPI0002F259E8|nr:hypothetical protein [Nocardia thailandica]
MADYPKYQTRPATVEAIHFRLGTSTKADLLAFCPDANIGAPNEDDTDIRWFIIGGPGGGEVQPNNWILRTPNGTTTVLREDVFARLYAPVADLPGKYSVRGFFHWAPVETAYGDEVSVYESSAASAPHVWLRIEDKDGRDIAAHLAVDQARTIRDQIDAWLTQAAA